MPDVDNLSCQLNQLVLLSVPAGLTAKRFGERRVLAAGLPVVTLLGGRHGPDIALYRAISQEAPEAMAGKVAYSSGFTGLGVAATRYGATVMLDLLSSRRNVWGEIRLLESLSQAVSLGKDTFTGGKGRDAAAGYPVRREADHPLPG